VVRHFYHERNKGDSMNTCFSESRSTEEKLYKETMIPMMVGKVIAGGTAPVTLARLRFETREQREQFLKDSQLLLEDKVMCFGEGEEQLVLMFTSHHYFEARHAWQSMKRCDGRVIKAGHSRQGGEALWDTYKQFNEEGVTPAVWREITMGKRLP
jgi:hypothetical protein